MGPRKRSDRDPLDRIPPVSWDQALHDGRRLIGDVPADGSDAAALGRKPVSVVQDAVRVVRQRQLDDTAQQRLILVQVELDFGDDADRAIAAQGSAEQRGIVFAAGLQQSSIGTQNLQRSHGSAQRAMP